MVRSYIKRHGNDVIGTSPGLETLAIIVMAPALMLVDVTLTWIRLYSDAEKGTRIHSILDVQISIYRAYPKCLNHHNKVTAFRVKLLKFIKNYV